MAFWRENRPGGAKAVDTGSGRGGQKPTCAPLPPSPPTGLPTELVRRSFGATSAPSFLSAFPGPPVFLAAGGTRSQEIPVLEIGEVAGTPERCVASV